MDRDSNETPKAPGPRKAACGPETDQTEKDPDVDPATASAVEEDDEARLPEVPDEPADAVGEGPLAIGHAAIENAVRLAPTSPGVYRMLNAASDVLYVGKAKNIRKRLSSYARVSAPQPARILRMIAATVSVEIVSTVTETEALLLEANLIKQLRPRFNVQLRDDKSFPYILISGDHWAPQILKHRGAQSRPGRYFGPFASAGAVNRTITALQRAFLIRSCTDGFFESRTRPCLLYQIRRCSRSISPAILSWCARRMISCPAAAIW
jgi:excinuclease ABC subunit C